MALATPIETNSRRYEVPGVCAIPICLDGLCASRIACFNVGQSKSHEAISRFFEMGLSIPEVAVISGHKDAL